VRNFIIKSILSVRDSGLLLLMADQVETGRTVTRWNMMDVSLGEASNCDWGSKKRLKICY
jgi:hypothetical protein